MNLEHYDIDFDDRRTVFEFTSVGVKGRITKVVQFSPISLKHLYNLGFGDKNELTGEVDDMVITNNGDAPKVLATVAFSVITFANECPDAMIYATGSTLSRTRLYRMEIARQLVAISEYFYVYGLLENEWEEFAANKNYQAFLIKRK
ncbi:MAG: hypothetical protein LBS94_01885 [Prevotellaceae bacterium]|jgi:hypothetical protein|nr:hypothetical protein [Prevotellaceae bacterium]